MDIRKYVSRSSQAKTSIQSSQTSTTLNTESNIILRNRYVRLRRNVQKINHFTVNRMLLKPQSETGMYDQTNQSEEFISNFIRCQKQQIASKLNQPIECSGELMRYIQSKTRAGREEESSFGNGAPTATTRNNIAEMRMSRTEKQQILPADLPQKDTTKEGIQQKMFCRTTESHSRQVSQSSTSPRKVDVASERTSYNSANVQMRLRRTPTQKGNASKADQQTVEEPAQVSQPEKKSKPVLLHDLKQLGHIKSESYAVVEYPSGQLILSFRAKQSLEIASLTKIMTCYLVMKLAEERNRNIFDETFDVREYVEYSTGTTAELIHGDCYTIEQLLYALMLPSGNDAALSLADWAGGVLNPGGDHKENIKIFVKEMNSRCKLLGLKDTRFGNPHGLPHKDTRSTAIDVSLLCAKCLDIPLFRKIISTKEFKTVIKNTDNLERQVRWENTNKLLRREGFLGIKTGITVTAGPCLASAYVFRDKTYVTVLLRANKVSRRFTETRKLLYWVLRTLHASTLSPKEIATLQDLRRNKRQFDSDNSEDEAEFKYSKESSEEFARRQKILKYQL